MHHFRRDTMTELHDSMTEALVLGTKDELDVISSVDVQMHNVIGYADSMEWDFDLKSMWLTPSRWTMMVNQYLDGDELEAWVGQCTGKISTRGRGIAVLRTKLVKPRGGAATGHTNKETRRWGACMLALSYRALPKPQITLHSRTSYLGYIGALDLSVAWMAGRYLAKEMGIDVKDMAFCWQIDAIQWHNFKSLAYLLNHRDETKRKQFRRLMLKNISSLEDGEVDMLRSYPGLNLTRKWVTKLRKEDHAGLTYGDMTYNTYRRIRRRYHTEVFGYDHAQKYEGWSLYKQGPNKGEEKEYFKAYLPLPSTPIDTLDFKKLGMPIDRSYGEPFVEGSWDDDDDDE